MIKKAAALFMSAILTTTTVLASDFDNMSKEEQAEAVGVYMEEIIKYINNNYIGGDNVDVESLMHTAIKAITKELDEYSDYLTPEEYNTIKEAENKIWYAPDFQCVFNEDGYPKISEITKNSRSYQAGLREGNEIRSIDGISAYGIGEEEYSSLVTKSSINNIKFKVASRNIISEISVPLVRVNTTTVYSTDISMLAKGAESVKFNDNSVGYIKITTFSNSTAEEFTRAVNNLLSEGKTKLILDLRENSGGYVEQAISIAQTIVPEGIIITTRDKNGNGTTYNSTLKNTPFEKYVVLVDSTTASASEILASAMQESGIAKIVGEQTYGKGVMQSVVDFSDAGVLKMTTHEYTTRLGNKINNEGITPDINVSKLMFVVEGADVNSPGVIAAMSFLGFKIDSNNSVEKAIGSYQAEMRLPITYKMDGETVNAINLEIYEDTLNNDRILTAGYISLLS